MLIYLANFNEDNDLLLVGDDQGYMNFIYINKKIILSSNAYGVWNTNTKANKKNESNQIHIYKVWNFSNIYIL